MRKPNFFIIGAPKCGTTSLAEWLSEHPNAFITDPKEPLFFNTDVGFLSTFDLQSYEALFLRTGSNHIAIGEASTSYLWSQDAVPSILRYSPGAKFIVLLRFPPEMALSMHAQECGGREDVGDFAAAWRLQPHRSQGHNLPAFCRAPDLYQYGMRCSVGSQLEKLFERVPNERALVLFLEDIAAEPEIQWQQVLAFLGLPEYYPGFDVKNSRRRIRSFVFKKLLNGVGHAKHRFGITKNFGFLAPFYRINTQHGLEKQQLEDLPASLKADLVACFEMEIAKVERLVGRVPNLWDEKWKSLKNQ